MHVCIHVYGCTYIVIYISVLMICIYIEIEIEEREKRKNDPDFIHKHYWHVIKCSNDPNNKIKCVGESDMLPPTQ